MSQRRDLFEAVAREQGIRGDIWRLDVTSSAPNNLRRWLLVERNHGSAAAEQPAYLSTHELPEHALTFHENDEYRQDWEPIALVDLDNGTTHTITVALRFDYEPPLLP